MVMCSFCVGWSLVRCWLVYWCVLVNSVDDVLVMCGQCVVYVLVVLVVCWLSVG